MRFLTDFDAAEKIIEAREMSRSSEKFMHGIKVLMAKNYIDNLLTCAHLAAMSRQFLSGSAVFLGSAVHSPAPRFARARVRIPGAQFVRAQKRPAACQFGRVFVARLGDDHQQELRI
jgi:hypothetical protein